MHTSPLKKLAWAAALFAGAFGIASAQAQVVTSFTGSYSQNFNVALSNSSTTLPPGFTSMVIAGGNSTYTAASPITAAGIESATGDTQTLKVWNAGTAVTDSGTQLFNIGCWDGITVDRALGSDPTGTAAQVIQLAMTNATGSPLSGVIFSYNCKCLTNGSVGTEQSELPGYCFFYCVGPTNLAANWIEVGVAGNVVGATNASGVPIANGLCLPNFTQDTTMSSGNVPIKFATPLANNGVMYFRWADDNNEANSPDQMIAIDDISITSYNGPAVSITSPANNATLTPGSSIPITASATETPDTITNVAFYSGTTLLGNITSSPYTYTWASVPQGVYTLTAVASDASGATATSAVVSITVDVPPTVNITSPANNAGFASGSRIAISASASGAGGSTVTNVAFYQGTTLLGNVAAAPYNFTWTGAAPGSYAITAVATDNIGASTTSSVVNLTVSFSTVFNGSYSQNFDSMGTAGTTLPPGFRSLVIAGSHDTYVAATPIDAPGIASATVDTQNLIVWNAGAAVTDSGSQLFNVGCWDSLGDRGLGSDPTGTAAQVIELSMTNTTGGPLTGVTFSYDCKCLTNGSAGTEESELPGYCFFYSLTGSTLASDWTEVGVAGNVVGGTNSSGVPIPNGLCLPNFTEGTTMSSGPVTILFPTPLPNGGVMFFRWADDNNIADSPDQMLAIDNINITLPGPVVNLTSPVNNASYLVSQPITMTANASEGGGGTITNVSFFIDGSSLITSFTGQPYTITIPGYTISAGPHTLTAVATDALGNSATSAVVNISVTTTPTPVVNLTSPAANANFTPGSSITINTTATESGGTITNVAFYAGATLLGNVTTPPSPYSYTWVNVSAGHYALTAVATDALGTSVTSAVVNISVGAVYSPPTVSITTPTNYTVASVPGSVTLSATAASASVTITNVAFYQGNTLLGNVTSAPYTFTWSNPAANSYVLTAVATDSTGNSTTSSKVNLTVVNTFATMIMKQARTIFVIPLENHDLTQASPASSPEQLLGNPACPYFNSLITPGNANAAQVSYATHYFSSAINGEHPSEPNYVWSEAGTDFGVRTDNDPSTSSGNLFSGVQHLSGQMTAAGVTWKTYQEDVQYSSSAAVSASGTGAVNIYNGTTEYAYAVKHNPMEFFTDTQNKNYYPLAQFFTDLANNNVAQYNWVTPNLYNEMHSSLPSGYTYHGVAYTGDQAAIAEGDNFLSIVIPQIMATAAYKNNGVIIIWTDETESTDDTGTTLPYVVISPLCKGNAYASPVNYSHSSDLKTMDELFGLAYQTNALPAAELDAQNAGYNYVFSANDISDMFQGVGVASSENPSGFTDNVAFTALVLGNSSPSGTVQFYTNGVAAGSPVTLVNSTATFSTSLLPRGVDTVTVQYSGDVNNLPSTNGLTQTVTNHPPVAGTAYYARGNNVPLIVRISDLLTNVTDLDGDTITLLGVGTDGANLLTTNGATLVTNSAFIFYTNSVTPNVNDGFSYSVSDGRGGSGLGMVLITMNNNLIGQTSPNLVVGNTSVAASFFGVPGYRYAVDRSTNLTPNVGLGWVPISTNTAPPSGLIQINDTFKDLGIPIPPLPSPVFYRLRYNP